MTADETISRLVQAHGEGGLSPTHADWRRIFEIDGPVRILNLLKFTETVETSDGPISGAQAYASYRSGNAAFSRVGGELLMFGEVSSSFALGGAPDWDAAIVTRYPSAQALADMWLDAEFIAAHKHRHEAVERSQVLVFAD